MKTREVYFVCSLVVGLLTLNAFSSCSTRGAGLGIVDVDLGHAPVAISTTTLATNRGTTSEPLLKMASTTYRPDDYTTKLDSYEKLFQKAQEQFGTFPAENYSSTTVQPIETTMNSIQKNLFPLDSSTKEATNIPYFTDIPDVAYKPNMTYELILNKCDPDVCTYKITCKCLIHTIIADGCGVALLEKWNRNGIELNNDCGKQMAKDAIQYNQPNVFMFLLNNGLAFSPKDGWFTMVQNSSYSNELKKNIFKHLIGKQSVDVSGLGNSIDDFNKAFQNCFQTGEFEKNKSLLEIFLANGADINKPLYPPSDVASNLLIHYIKGKEDLLDLNRIKFLVENGANLGQKIEVNGQHITILAYLRIKLSVFQLLRGPYARHIEPYQSLIDFLASKQISVSVRPIAST